MHRVLGIVLLAWLYGLAFFTLFDLFGWLGVGLVIFFPVIIPLVPLYLVLHGQWGPLVGIIVCFMLYTWTEPRPLEQYTWTEPKPLEQKADPNEQIKRQLGHKF